MQITLNPLQNLYTVLDNSGNRVAPGATLLSRLADIQRNNPDYIVSSDPARFIRNFTTDFGVSVGESNSVFINPRLQSTFIYLPEDEQKVFASRPLSYIVTQNTSYPFPGQYNRQVLDLEAVDRQARISNSFKVVIRGQSCKEVHGLFLLNLVAVADYAEGSDDPLLSIRDEDARGYCRLIRRCPSGNAVGSQRISEPVREIREIVAKQSVGTALYKH